MNPVLEALLGAVDVLEREDITYAITGSFAAAHHGYVRATEDVDIQVSLRRPSELEALAAHLPMEVRRIDPGTWGFPSDVHVELYPLRDRLDEITMRDRVEGEAPGDVDRSLWFVPLEALLVLKLRERIRHKHGLKHVADIQQLLARNHDELDVEELERLLALDAEWARAWDEFVEER